MRCTIRWISAGLIVLAAQVAHAQNKNPDTTAAPVPDQATPQAQSTTPQTTDPALPPRVERRIERRELRQSGQLPAARANAPLLNGSGVDINIPAAGVDVNAKPGAGVGIIAPGVGVGVPPAGSGAAASVNVPAAGIQGNVANPNTWRYRWHNNRWWYWHPNNRWSFWNDNRWNAYSAPANVTANAPLATRRYSTTPRYESGYRGLQNSPAPQAQAPVDANVPRGNTVPGFPTVPAQRRRAVI